MTLGERIRHLRQNKNLKQEELAAVLGVTQSSVANYETNFRKPPYEVLIKLSNCFKVSTDFLLTGTVPFGQEEDDHIIREIPVVVGISADNREGNPVFKFVTHFEPVLLDVHTKGAFFSLPIDSANLTGGRINQGDKLLVREQNTAKDGDIILAVRMPEDKIVIGQYLVEDDVIVVNPLNPDSRPLILRGDSAETPLVIVGKVISGSYCFEEFSVDDVQKQEEENESGDGTDWGEVG